MRWRKDGLKFALRPHTCWNPWSYTKLPEGCGGKFWLEVGYRGNTHCGYVWFHRECYNPEVKVCDKGRIHT